MKHSYIFILFCSIVFALSCNNKRDEATTARVQAFDSVWNQTEAVSSAWSGELKQTLELCEEDVQRGKEHKFTSGAEKRRADSILAEMDVTLKSLRGLWDTYNAFSKQWEADTKGWQDWKARYDTGAVKKEEAEEKLAALNRQLNQANKELAEWTSHYNVQRANYERNSARLLPLLPALKTDTVI